MKKLLALFLALVLCFGMIPFGTVAMAEETSTDVVIEAGKTVDFTTANNFPEFEVTFDTPIDCSGSNNTIKVTSSCESQSHTNICYYLTIYTTNKTSTEYYKGYNSSDEVVIISLDSLGLSDEDLASVTGYKFKPGIRGGLDVTDYTFSITVPRKLENVTGVVTDTIDKDVKIATGTASATKTYEKLFETPLDCSGSAGVISVSEKMDVACDGYYYLTIYTSEKTSNRLMVHGWQSYAADTEFISDVTLDSLGLTDDDLKLITGYKIEAHSRYNAVDQYYTFSITVPKKDDRAIAEYIKLSTGTTNATITHEETFDAPLDLSGSAGAILVSEKMAVGCQGYYYLTIYTSAKTSTRLMVHGWQAYTANTEFISEVTLNSLGLTDDDLKAVTGYKIEAVSRYNASSTYYTFSIKVPEKNPRAIAEYVQISTGTASATITHEETFDAPLDLSGSAGAILVSEKMGLDCQGYYYLTIYTSAKTSTRLMVHGWQSYTANTELVSEVSLDSLGLTDDDLKAVTGYKIEATSRNNASNTKYSFSIVVPVPEVEEPDVEEPEVETIVTNVVEAGASVTVGGWSGTVKTLEKSFEDAPLDLSLSKGVFVVTEKVSVTQEGYYTFTIYANGKTATSNKRFGWGTTRTAGEIYTTEFTIDELGLTMEDLKMVTGYKIEACARSDEYAYFTFTIKAPYATPTFDSEEYADLPTVYDNGDLRILPDTFYDDVIEYYPSAVITDSNGAVVDGGPVVTGMIIKLMNGEIEIDSARIVVYDDLDRDGSLTGSDLVVLRKVLLGEEELADDQSSAIAHHGYTTVDARNIVRMKKILAGTVVVGQVSVTD